MNKKLIHKILLVISIIVALLLNKDFELLSIATTLALIFGFINIYYTVNRSKWFIWADLLWILFSLITLGLTQNYTDIWLYIFYFFVGFYQFINWSNHESNGEFTIVYPSEVIVETWGWLILGFGITLSIIILDTYAGLNSNNLLLGAIISGFGIVASVMLAKRQYFSEIIYFFVNFLQIVLYVLSGLYSLALIPLIFWIFTILFLVENRKNKDHL